MYLRGLEMKFGNTNIMGSPHGGDWRRKISLDFPMNMPFFLSCVLQGEVHFWGGLRGGQVLGGKNG